MCVCVCVSLWGPRYYSLKVGTFCFSHGLGAGLSTGPEQSEGSQLDFWARQADRCVSDGFSSVCWSTGLAGRQKKIDLWRVGHILCLLCYSFCLFSIIGGFSQGLRADLMPSQERYLVIVQFAANQKAALQPLNQACSVWRISTSEEVL